jgi:hypothetical protein
MSPIAFVMLALVGASEPEAYTGIVRVSAQAGAPAVSLVVDNTEVFALRGELADEVAKLQGARVEVIGTRDETRFVVRNYHIVDLGGGVRPTLVGSLVANGDGDVALSDGPGTPIPLAASPKLKRRLLPLIGGKVWVIGEKLVSGELKVTRFGVLSEPKPVVPKLRAHGNEQGEQ